ncbi:quinone oxidoreductase-like isoform X2 [Biomphalaria pfeifferi]|uniref:Quinone oxidoreductase-like isoform X2 n=1 Tax=Biomphalaria pfeifferi TaxID=112525 RepID=A0AAD8FKT2_BIOPF|nr:quinone oxidoreductase-like isoform X2 [Biomphalaria pfeifferi]
MSTRRFSSLVMKAIRVAKFGGVENLKLETDVPIPTPSDSEVLIKIHAAGINPVDTYIRTGTYSRVPQLPYTPGQDAAGVVEAVGERVTQFKKGDRVFTMTSVSGTYAEFATANIKFVAHLDDKLSFAQGASFGVPYYTAYKSLFLRAQAKPGETVLVHGASGGVGLAAVQLAKSHGLRVVGTAGTKEGLDLVKKNGADFVYNHREPDYLDKVIKEVEGGIDIVLEMLANVNLQNDLNIVNFRGRIVVIGCRGSIQINPRLSMGKESNIMGVALMTSTEADWKEMHAALQAGQRTGCLVPHIGKIYSLKEADRAQNDVINNAGTFGNLVLQIA